MSASAARAEYTALLSRTLPAVIRSEAENERCIRLLEELDREGPQETQAGEQNAISTTTMAGFRHHSGAWLPHGAGDLRYYAHAVTWP